MRTRVFSCGEVLADVTCNVMTECVVRVVLFSGITRRKGGCMRLSNIVLNRCTRSFEEGITKDTYTHEKSQGVDKRTGSFERV